MRRAYRETVAASQPRTGCANATGAILRTFAATLRHDRKERDGMLVTTTNAIEGQTVTPYLGLATAQGVLGVNAFKDAVKLA